MNLKYCKKCGKGYEDLLPGKICGKCWNRPRVEDAGAAIRVYKAALVQLITEYYQDRKRRSYLKRWVKSMQGGFEVFALAVDIEKLKLRDMLLDKMKRIDDGEELKNFKGGDN